MDGTVKLPGIGPVKKSYAIAGVGIIGGVLVYAYWKRSQTPPAAPPAASPDTTASTTDTGYVEDSTAAGYNTVYPSAYGGQSPWGYDIYGNPLPAPAGAGSGGVFTTNNDWATAAESALVDGGITLAVASTAITRVLGGLSVDSTQKDMFMRMVGQLGQPPQGYPQPIKLVDTPAQPAPPSYKNADMWVSNGKYSLNTIAKSHHTDAAHIIWLTTSNWSQPTFNSYVDKHNYDAHLPSGIRIYTPKGK